MKLFYALCICILLVHPAPNTYSSPIFCTSNNPHPRPRSSSLISSGRLTIVAPTALKKENKISWQYLYKICNSHQALDIFKLKHSFQTFCLTQQPIQYQAGSSRNLSSFTSNSWYAPLQCLLKTQQLIGCKWRKISQYVTCNQSAAGSVM